MIRSESIGGGIVRRQIMAGDRVINAGTALSGDEIRAFRNHREMIRTGRIETWPADPRAGGPAGGQRFVVSIGFGKFDVIEGRKLNDAPLTKAEAAKLAGRPEEDATTKPDKEKEPA